MRDHAVLIAGGGPTGLMLAGELALAGVAVAIVERRASQALAGSRAGGLHARTLEVLDQRGLAERFVAQGRVHRAASFHAFPLDMGGLHTRHDYVLALWQNEIERILAEWVAELQVPIYRSTEVIGFAVDTEGVTVATADGRAFRAQYLVGCDGGRSVVRKAAGIEFAGWDATTSWLIAEVEYGEEPAWGMRHDARGTHAIGPLDGERRMRVVLTEASVGAAGEPTLADLHAALRGAYGTDFGAREPSWLSRFTDLTRQATAYRAGRVLLAGDAAHVHPPVGGQGLNVGVQDAVNLGWKLARVVRGISAPTLLDTYHAERHPIAERVLRNTMAQMALRRPDERTKALGEFLAPLLALDESRRRIAAEISGLDVRYDLGEGHPLLGRRLPDVDLVVDGAPARAYGLLHAGRALLLHFGAAGAFDGAVAAERVDVVEATTAAAWELPVIGAVAPPAAVLVRPDGHVAWIGNSPDREFAAALARWFGAPAPA